MRSTPRWAAFFQVLITGLVLPLPAGDAAAGRLLQGKQVARHLAESLVPFRGGKQGFYRALRELLVISRGSL